MKRKSPARFARRSYLLILTCALLFTLVFLAASRRSVTVEAQQEEAQSPSVVVFNETFDGVVAPALPAGWTTSVTGQITPFGTITNMPDSPPNCLFVDDPNTSGTSQLVSPAIALGASRHKLLFSHVYAMDYEFDGGVLEISTNGGAFQDIVTAGGVFISGGYDTLLVGGTLSGRNSWSGMQVGYMTTKISLPASTSNQSVRFRWRIGTDNMESGAGWRIDNMQVVDEPAQPATVGLNETFDFVTAPALPAGWTATATGGVPTFRTGAGDNIAHTAPNTAYAPTANVAGTSDIVSPPVLMGSNPATISFRHSIGTDAGFDGGVLEMKIGAGAFQDIIAAGGTFIEGGYFAGATITSPTNPLFGRAAWGGTNGTTRPPYIKTTVNLPAAVANQTIQFRWRFGLDATAGINYGGWWIDNARVESFIPSAIGFTENFDALTAPQLPVGWTTNLIGAGTLFVTSAATPDSPPNAAFTTNPAQAGSSELVSPVVRVGGNAPKIIFRHNYQTENNFDGGVLEIKINNDNFQDIIQAGGSFVTNGYTGALGGSGNPLAGRQGWEDNSNGYVTTEVNLPIAAYRQNVQFRWRFGSDSSFAGTGWRIDSIQVTNAISGENVAAISIPASGAAQPYPSEINVTDHEGLVSGVIVNIDNFTHASPDDVDLMLVAPNGRKVVLMSDVGGANPVNNLSLSFEDSAAATLPDNAPLTSGNFKPANYETGDAFPAPAPQGAPTGNLLSAFNGSEPNGAWKLFLVDDNGGNAGALSAGWSIVVQTSPNLLNIAANGAAEPYPSQVSISGLQGTVTKAVVTLTNFSHLSPDDVDIMLVAPNGRRMVLMSDVGGTNEVGGVNLIFDDAATTNLPDSGQIVSGSYKPTNFETGDLFPAPAPQGAPTGTTLNAFYGSPANGTWKLYVTDDNGENFGSIAEIFSLNLTTSTGACAFVLSPTGQGFPITGGSNSLNVNMPSGCPWTASVNTSFVTINSSLTGEGFGAINYTVAPNFDAGRTANIIVTNGVFSQSFLIQQPSGCPFALNTTAQSVPASGGGRSVAVTAGAICSYLATSNASWIQITSPTQSGDANVNFTVAPNPSGTLRSGTIIIGARTLTVNQAGATSRKFDFDGDSKADVSVYRPSNGTWYVQNSGSGNSLSAAAFGIAADKLVPADYDGDRKTDFAVFRDGVWYILQSQTNTVRSINWGLGTDTPTPGDYDGDGKTDVAVFRATDGNWYVLRSASGTGQAVTFGGASDKAVAGDYDGDGRADFAVYRSGASAGWYILSSGSSATVTSRAFGTTGDIAVPGDYDGDGRDNIAVFRPSNGTWYLAANDGSGFEARAFGQAGDVPAAADYNGDGRTDIGVFRAGAWYILLLGSETFRTEQWGLASDAPVESAFNRQ